MPIEIGEVNAEVEVDAAGGGSGGEQPHSEASAEALQRWQEVARRDTQLAARTQAWGFDD
ncbi:conserved hypothetical protein [Candidatus Accumulibacter aalborgensis]|uniref:Uncharacterized protein n=1 Tax=Candidatus Accumulibacter aalborgensis TaxID=1860102 RepID=A0A1A8XQT8_9PROT|nr:hypothetical protein [Candidatus Accumulibacter aalborgensis]SBT07504.1 conserved hypothetical protein [Candidatus Accumulibacter aalborgensis]